MFLMLGRFRSDLHKLPIIIPMVLFPHLIFGLLSGLLSRGGLVLRWLGIAVVTSSGSEVSRSRALWRSVIAWSPCVAVILIAPILFFLSLSVSLSIIGVLLAVSLFGIIAAIINPEQGLQDRLAGTYLVPR
jgi:eukaryotic-like serine/threonine-protein kinase